MKIAIISSASNEYPKGLNAIASELIAAIATIPDVEIFTGGSSGVPGLLTQKANHANIKTTAYSPDKTAAGHDRRHDNLKSHHFDEMRHIEGFTARSLAMIMDADAIIALNGRVGTLSEITIALEEGKRVAVLTGTGGIADHAESIVALCRKKFPGQLMFSDKPEDVVRWVNRQYKKPSQS